MKLHEAVGQAGYVLLDMMMTNTAYNAGEATVYVHACSLDGKETHAVFLADTELEIDEDGTASATDIDGTEYVLQFLVPMKA